MNNGNDEIRRLRRAVKLLEVNPDLVANRRITYSNDISDLKESIQQKEGLLLYTVLYYTI